MLRVSRLNLVEIGYYEDKCLTYIDSLLNHNIEMTNYIEMLLKKNPLNFLKKFFIKKENIKTVILQTNNIKQICLNGKTVEVSHIEFYKSKGILELELLDSELDHVDLEVIAYKKHDIRINRSIEFFIVKESEYLQ